MEIKNFTPAPLSDMYDPTEVIMFLALGRGEVANIRGNDYMSYKSSALSVLTPMGFTFQGRFAMDIPLSEKGDTRFKSFSDKAKYMPNDQEHAMNLWTYVISDIQAPSAVFLAKGDYDKAVPFKEQIHRLVTNCLMESFDSISSEEIGNMNEIGLKKKIKSKMQKHEPSFMNMQNLDFSPFDIKEGNPAMIQIKESEDRMEAKNNSTADSNSPQPVSYLRPNGSVYYARNVMGNEDVTLLRAFRQNGQYCQLAGVPGSGKTALVEAAFGDELLTIVGNSDTLVSHFVGGYKPNTEKNADNPQDYVWSDGVLTRAMKEGRPLLVDEVNRIPAGVADILLSATDGRNYITLDDLPNAPKVYGAEGFYVVLAYNPDILSGNELDEAIKSRFGIIINVESDLDSLHYMGIPLSVSKVAHRMNIKSREDRDRGGRGLWVPQIRELLQFKKIVDSGLSEDFAFSNLINQCPEYDLPELLDSINNFNATQDGLHLGEMVVSPN